MRQILPVTFFLTLLVAGIARGQYYDWGQDPASIRWRSVRDSSMQVVYPDYFEQKAHNTLRYFQSARPFIYHGYTKGVMDVPVVLRTQNLNPNGIVMLAPRRIELITSPGSGGYATPWLKQLAVHEYRHAVQFNNLNTGVIRWLRYILGEQGWMLGTWGLPLWMMEGDAVMSETQFTTFGRAMQPSYSIEYRAMHGEGMSRYRTDKYFSGSYKDNIPDHYKLGYQLISYAYERYDDSVAYRVANFWTRRPYFIFTTNIALNRYYGTNERTLLANAFDALGRHWDSIPQGRNDFEILDTPHTSYTTYRSPLTPGDSTIYALKTDFDRYNRIVSIDPASGTERMVRHTGFVNTPLTYSDGKLYWTELRSSTFWEQRVNSVLCSYDLRSGKQATVHGVRNAIFPASTGNGSLSYATHNLDGSFAVHTADRQIRLPDSISLHGLAGDALSGRLYMIALSDGGMWIGEILPQGGFRQLTLASRASIDNLTAAGGRLLYNSIATGKDEIHIYDVASDTEYRLTDSRYGSFAPSFSANGSDVTFVTYAHARNGYAVARKGFILDSLERLAFSYVPENIVNPVRRRWNVFNIDTVKTDYSAEPLAGSRRYRKSAHLVNIHSWAPVYFEPENLLDDFNPNVQLGATLVSQNILSSAVSRIGYGYSSSGGHMVGAAFHYYGWAPKFELSGVWGGGNQAVYSFVSSPPAADISKRHFKLSLTSFLPFTFDGGYHIRRLVPMLEFSHINGLLLKSDTTTFRSGYQKMAASIYFSDNVRMAYRDFLPRFGYLVRAAYVSNPFSSDFGQIWSLFGRIYLPGAALHHSLMFRGVTQRQTRGLYNFSRNEIYPRGMSYTLIASCTNAFSADYQLPVCYPDWGINSLLFIKRIRVNVGWDYARQRLFNSGGMHNTTSAGGDLYVDFTVNRMPAAATSTVKISVYKPSGDDLYVGVGFTLPI